MAVIALSPVRVGLAQTATPTTDLPTPVTVKPIPTGAPKPVATSTRPAAAPSGTPSPVVPTGTSAPPLPTSSRTPNVTSGAPAAPTATLVSILGGALPTALTSPTSTLVAALSVDSIAPPQMTNDAPREIVITGQGFASDVVVRLAGQALDPVRVDSSTQLSARVPEGLCAGTFSATVADGAGRVATGGNLVVETVQRVTRHPQPLAIPSMALTGRAQVIRLPLPPMDVQATSCGNRDVQVQFSISGLRPDADGLGAALTVRALELTWPGVARQVRGALAAEGGRGRVALPVPAAVARAGVTIQPVVEIEIPANAYAGRYTGDLDVTTTGGP